MKNFLSSLIKKLSGCLKLVLAIIFSLFSSLFNLAFADSITDTANYLPGGQYRMFGAGRGSVANLSNNIRMQGGLSQQAGNLAIETRIYRGNLSYTQEFNNHTWKEHSPFATYAHQDFHNKKGKIANGGGATLTDLSVSGYKIHPADGYDGEQSKPADAPLTMRNDNQCHGNWTEGTTHIATNLENGLCHPLGTSRGQSCHFRRLRMEHR